MLKEKEVDAAPATSLEILDKDLTEKPFNPGLSERLSWYLYTPLSFDLIWRYFTGLLSSLLYRLSSICTPLELFIATSLLVSRTSF